MEGTELRTEGIEVLGSSDLQESPIDYSLIHEKSEDTPRGHVTSECGPRRSGFGFHLRVDQKEISSPKRRHLTTPALSRTQITLIIV